MGIGSWPRPGWMLRTMHDRLEGRLDDGEFRAAADDAVRLCIDAQVRAGVDVVTDGEQRRDGYASFVGGLLDNCQLIPLGDLAAMVDDPARFESELRALDVPAGEVRHPVVYGKLGRSRPLAVHEVEFARACSGRPVKAALPGPYLLTRTMWLDCLTDRPYETREDLARDVVRVLREEAHFLLAAGAAIVQIDEPVLTEVVLGGRRAGHSFMCGALSERLEPGPELDFAAGLLDEMVRGLPRERMALHVCRGNWTRDESAVLAGGYLPLVDLLGASTLESCSWRWPRPARATRRSCAAFQATGESAWAWSTPRRARWSLRRQSASAYPGPSTCSGGSACCWPPTADSPPSPTTPSRPPPSPRPSSGP